MYAESGTRTSWKMAYRGRFGSFGDRRNRDFIVENRPVSSAGRFSMEREKLENLLSIDDEYHFIYNTYFGGLVVPYIQT